MAPSRNEGKYRELKQQMLRHFIRRVLMMSDISNVKNWFDGQLDWGSASALTALLFQNGNDIGTEVDASHIDALGVASESERTDSPGSKTVRGLGLYRTGRWEDAIELLADNSADNCIAEINRLVLSMSHYKLSFFERGNHLEKAREQFELGTNGHLVRDARKPMLGDRNEFRVNELMTDVIRREAESLLNDEGKWWEAVSNWEAESDSVK